MKNAQHILTAGLLALALGAPASAQHDGGNLIDPSFETEPLEVASEVLGAFDSGVWGQEAATISEAVGMIAPLDGIQMLRMEPDGQTTSAYQITSLSAYKAYIDAGSATLSLTGYFNAQGPAEAGIRAYFFADPVWVPGLPGPSDAMVLDSDPATWQWISIEDVDIPAGTRWVVTEVNYTSATMGAQPGFVDYVDFRVNGIPYPDCDLDGRFTPVDFFCWLRLFNERHPYADCDGDGEFTFFDFLCFQDEYCAYCGTPGCCPF